jgi:hypothetical protein
MTNFIAGIIGIAGVLAFLGILLWWTKALPLIVVVTVVMLLLLVDFVQSQRAGNGSSG